MFRSSLSLLLCFVLTAGCAQDVDRQKLDGFLNKLAEKDKGMGSLAISKKGKIVYSKAVGLASINGDKTVPATAKTKYRIGSITKMFTGVIILQLVEEKKLSLNETLLTYFPGLPNADKITVGQLLNHRSGIHNFTNDSLYMSYYQSPKSRQEMLDIMYKANPDFAPGSRAEYSNSNFLLLGYLAEMITEKSYADLIEKRIAKKLDLEDTYVGGKIDVQKNESQSFRNATAWKVETETDMSIPGAAGALVSTPSDLVNFINGLFTGKLLSPASLEKMKTLQDDYGMAMFQIPFYDKLAFGHNGGIDGFGSVLGYFPKDSVAFCYLSNGIVYPINDVIIGVLSIYFNKPYAIPTFETVRVENIDQYIGDYASTQMPLKITIRADGKQLTAQATGQGSFPLEPKGNHVFQFDPAGIIMVFDPAKKEFTLKQGGGTYLFKKEG